MATTDYRIEITLCEGDFEASMGRQPRSQEEFDEWCRLAEKGLLNGHIDWDIIYECTREALASLPPHLPKKNALILSQ